MALLGAWNVGMLVLTVLAERSYEACMADDGFMCFDLVLPLLFVTLAVDGLVGLVVWLVSALLRRREARRPVAGG
jgi:hypothetical protein